MSDLRGPDRPPRANCTDAPGPFDILADKTAGPTWRWALDEARKMCDGCDIRQSCHEANGAEQWLTALRKTDPDGCAHCGNEFEQKTFGPPAKYCGIACRRAAEYLRRKEAAA